MACPAFEFFKYNFPISNFSSNKYLKFIEDRIVSGAREIVECEKGNDADELLKRVGDVPKRGEYEGLLRKYGYLVGVEDPIDFIFTEFEGRIVNSELRKDYEMELLLRTLYNPFSPFAAVPPQGLAQPFEKLIIQIAKEHFDGAITKSRTLNPGTDREIPSTRYDLYDVVNDRKLEVKTTRLIDASGIGNMARRFLPYGLGRKFTTGFKQVKLRYSDVFITNIVSRNVSLYAVYSNDSYRGLIIDGFVEKVPMKNLAVSLVHNVKKSPKSREERLRIIDDSEFIITFTTYTGLKNYLKYADYVSFDILSIVKYVVDGFE